MTGASNTDPVAPAALRSFWRLARRWSLGDHEAAVLLGLDQTHAATTRDGNLAGVTPDTLVRISHLLGIFKALHGLLPEDHADAWLRRVNNGEPFAGASALDRMLRGGVNDLVVTRSYLEAELHR